MNTPRTDAVIHNGTCSDAVNKYREVSRQLEKECAELRRYLEHALENVNVDTSCDVCQEARAVLAKVPK